MSNDIRWKVHYDGGELGEFTEAEIRARYANGLIQPGVTLSREGIPETDIAVVFPQNSRPLTHSDYIVHWTGREILEEKGVDRIPHFPVRKYDPDIVNAFLKRLKDILRYGLWMTKNESKNESDHCIVVNKTLLKKPDVARVCFTELKLSDSQWHAGAFGPLGIGVKRYYLFNRLGAPVHYIHDTPSLFLPPFSGVSQEEEQVSPVAYAVSDPESPDFELFSFYKNMSRSRSEQGFLEYDLYEESEWRIIFSDDIRRRLLKEKLKYFVDPKNPPDDLPDKVRDDIRRFYESLESKTKPEYLLPLDEWFALIVYPNLQIKNASFADEEIRNLIDELKSPKKLRGESPVLAEGLVREEIINRPMEIDFGAMKHF